MANLKYSDDELIKLYRGAADKNKQIEILADMRCCKPQEIIQMLADAGEIPGMRKREDAGRTVGDAGPYRNDRAGKVKKMKAPRWTSEELEQVQNLIDEGMSYSEIADKFGRNKQAIYDAVSKNKLRGKNWQIQNVLPREKKAKDKRITMLSNAIADAGAAAKILHDLIRIAGSGIEDMCEDPGGVYQMMFSTMEDVVKDVRRFLNETGEEYDG